MPTAARVLSVAREEIGTTEAPAGSNRTKYGAWYGMDGNAWCAMFVSWVLDQAAITGFRHAYTPYGVDLFKKAGRWYDKPRPGDIAFFDFPDSTYRVQHVGIVVRNNRNGTITTIEGNTSRGLTGSQDNGGGVFKRVRPKAHIVGYGRPPYEKDTDYVVRTPNKTFRFERLRMAQLKVRARLKAGKAVSFKPV